MNAVNVKVYGEAPGGDGGGDSDGTIYYAAVTALDAPIVHLDGAAGTADGVKFKAGAELSKAVN
jgi:hypothetical protein